VINAIVDALSEFGVTRIEMPATARECLACYSGRWPIMSGGAYRGLAPPRRRQGVTPGG